MVNNDTVNHEQEPLPSGHVYCPPQNMTNYNLGAKEPSSDIFYNSYMQTKGYLKVGDMFLTKEDCVRAIKKYHMEISADYTIDRTNVTRYKILCRNMLCMCQVTTSYQNMSDSWEIGFMGPSHTCIITNSV